MKPPVPPRLLVVDDDCNIRRLSRTMLERAGYDVVEARDGNEALRVVDAAGPIDALIADVNMPVLEGDEMARQLLLARPKLKVLYVTGFAEQLLSRRVLVRENEAFLAKPFTRRDLLEAVSLLLFGHMNGPTWRTSRRIDQTLVWGAN